MGCGQKAAADDAAEYAWAIEQIGLKGDKKYSAAEYESDIVTAAHNKMQGDAAIKFLIEKRHERLAAQEFYEEMKERKLLKKLKEKY